MADASRPLVGEQGNQAEPGFGTALLAVGVMLLTTAILCILIYVLMVAISPLDSRRAGGGASTEAPVAQPQPQAPAPAPAPR